MLAAEYLRFFLICPYICPAIIAIICFTLIRKE